MTQSNRSKSLVPAKQSVAEANYANYDQTSQYLTFFLNQELYAFGILHVKEILEYGKVTKVPMMPAFIEGVINLRGEVIPVVNLANRFGLLAGTVTRRTCIVIVEIKHEDTEQVIGVMVDSVSEVLEIEGDNLRSTPSFGASIRTDFIKAMGKIDDDFVIILAEDRVLSIEEMALMEQVRDMAMDEGLS
ncbi:purine-binding chemotaxis protein CheW [Shewanella avicenniae]|uniref:Purine-binding chemotaxis protein CheW n=1 Tax=Shewanella avicenniae TaxID=2814294 RepID=A0ABX7QNZ3_9GAMM|nr:chemotaxis protein CheW [Shewanella avicenniae]QSX33192.1 purine-binding chemotaxis protein CheW [Shewanella avicenniae]